MSWPAGDPVLVPGDQGCWFGGWDEYHGNYHWQRLRTEQRALGDCRAVIDVLTTMAHDALSRPASLVGGKVLGT